jgi:hypothetical protein
MQHLHNRKLNVMKHANPSPPSPLISALADVLMWLDRHDATKNPDNAPTLDGGREIGADETASFGGDSDESLQQPS